MQKYYWICCVFVSWVWGLPWSAGSILIETPLEKTNFSLPVSIKVASLLGVGAHVDFPLSVLRPPSAWTCTALCVLPQSPWILMCICPVVSCSLAILGCLGVSMGPLWPITQLDVTSSQSGKLHLLMRDVQLGLCLPHYLVSPFRSLWCTQSSVVGFEMTLLSVISVIPLSLPFPSSSPLRSPLLSLHNNIFHFPFLGRPSLPFYSLSLYLTSVATQSVTCLFKT